MTAATAVRCSGLGVEIDDRALLHDIDLTVTVGEWISIIGPNGAGKSTLLRSIAGVQAHAGEIDVVGQSSAQLSTRERAKLLAWVPQTPVIPAGMRVLDYVLLGRTPHLSPLGGESTADVELARAMLEQLDITDFGARFVSTLSGGERQRVLLARALCQQTPLVLLDEPTTALDIGHQQDVLELLEAIRSDGGRTLVTTMHDLTLAGQYADRLVLLDGGEIVAEGSAADVLTEDNIKRHYGAEVAIDNDDGHITVMPRRRSTLSLNETSLNEASPTKGAPTNDE